MTTFARSLALLVALLVGAVSVVEAAPRGGKKGEAAAHFQKGKALYAEERWAEALDAFQAGFDAFPLRGFLVNIGQCQRKLGRLADAAASYEKFLSSHGGDGALRAEVEEALAEVRTEVKRTELEAARTAPPPEPAPTPAPSSPEDDPAPRRAGSGSSLSVNGSLTARPTERRREDGVHKKSRWWVWTLVGVVAAGAVAGAVVGGVMATQPPSGGSLGLVDGRR